MRAIGKLIGVCVALFLVPSLEGAEAKYPSHLSEYDFATAEDLVFYRHVAPLFSREKAASWRILARIND